MNSLSHNVLSTIGDTPLIKLQKIVPANCADIYVKLESVNPTGSYKDRMALAMIEEAENRGDLKEGMTVVEATGGSTGTSLAFICAVKGYKFNVVSSDVFAKEKLQTMRLFGAEAEIIKSENGVITPDLVPKMLARAAEIARQPGTYPTRQFENRDAIIGYANIGKEILQQSPGHIDVFCAAVGTAGMAMGVSQELKAADASTRVVVLEPASSPVLSKGIKGSHKVDGIGVGFVPPHLDKQLYDEVLAIEEHEARDTARLLAKTEGIFGGTSSGLNVAAAIRIGQQLGKGHTVVTVIVDSGMKYLNSGLFD